MSDPRPVEPPRSPDTWRSLGEVARALVRKMQEERDADRRRSDD